MPRARLLLLNGKDSHRLEDPILLGKEKDKFKHTLSLLHVSLLCEQMIG